MKKKPVIICLLMVCVSVIIAIVLRPILSPEVSAEQGRDGSAGSLQGGAGEKSSRRSSGDRSNRNKTQRWERTLRPFKVVKSSDRFEWTAEDGKSDDVIKVLANNDHMEETLLKANAWTNRRQLVYVDPQFSADMKSVFSGELGEITLPGFDGEEFKVEIPSGSASGDRVNLTGSFVGLVSDLEGTRVVAGADGDTWSIGIQLPDRFYQISTREHGEWVISDIDFRAMNANTRPNSDRRSIDDVGNPILDQ